MGESESCEVTGNTARLYDKTFVGKIIDWALKRVGGGVGLYRYGDPESETDKVRGALLYQEFLTINADTYYPKKKDLEAFQFAAGQIGKLMEGDVTLITQGPGQSFREKDFYLAAQFDSVAACIVNDISSEYGDSAKNAAREQFSISQNQAIAVQKNFFKEKTIDPTFDAQFPNFDFKGTPVMVVAGLTLSNMEGVPEDGLPKDQVISILKRWRGDLTEAYNRASHPKGKPLLILSVDHSQDGPMIEAAYQGQERFTLNFPHRIIRDAPVSEGFDPEGFDVEYKWHPESHVITHVLIPKKDMRYSIDGVPVFMSKGERFIVNNTYKYPENEFEDMTNEAGYTVKAKIQQPGNPIAVYVLEV